MLETLKTVAPERRCYRLVGGVLCARTVKDVMPELDSNRGQLEHMVALGNEQLAKKGLEINKYITENNIRVKGEGDGSSPLMEAAVEASAAADRSQVLLTN